ncbi:LamG domain-containing protein [Verrucomicrobia bacterium]|nr:LamG domain-containing protein [Verrucomicrobiota bacterium]
MKYLFGFFIGLLTMPLFVTAQLDETLIESLSLEGAPINPIRGIAGSVNVSYINEALPSGDRNVAYFDTADSEITGDVGSVNELKQFTMSLWFRLEEKQVAGLRGKTYYIYTQSSLPATDPRPGATFRLAFHQNNEKAMSLHVAAWNRESLIGNFEEWNVLDFDNFLSGNSVFGVWHQLTLTLNHEGVLKCFLDGRFKSEGLIHDVSHPETNRWSLGNHVDKHTDAYGHALAFNGAMSDFRIYNYPMQPSEVQTLYNETAKPKLNILVKTVDIVMNLITGRRYYIESSKDFQTWKLEENFVATSSVMSIVFDVAESGRYFRVIER